MTTLQVRGSRDSFADSPRDAFIARQRSILMWCDFHLMTVYNLAPLMTDSPATVASALAEVLADPQNLADRRPCHSRNTRAFPFSSDRCPDEDTGLDRVELALSLLGQRTSAGVSATLGVPEHAVMARLHSGLTALFAPCDSRGPRGRRR